MEVDITGIILAGGRSRRMGGVDKAFIELRDKPLIAWVIDRISPQVTRIYISTGNQTENYRVFGFPVIPDTIGPDIGPLAGILAGLERAPARYLLTAPCDTPLLPSNLCTKLYQQMRSSSAMAATVYDGSKIHPVVSLLDCALAGSLRAYLAAGHRSVTGWLESISALQVDFSDQQTAFINLNTPADLSICNMCVDVDRPRSVRSCE